MKEKLILNIQEYPKYSRPTNLDGMTELRLRTILKRLRKEDSIRGSVR